MPLSSQMNQQNNNNRRRRLPQQQQQQIGSLGGPMQTPGQSQGGAQTTGMGAQIAGDTAGVTPALRQNLENRVSGEQRMAQGGAMGGQATGNRVPGSDLTMGTQPNRAAVINAGDGRQAVPGSGASWGNVGGPAAGGGYDKRPGGFGGTNVNPGGGGGGGGNPRPDTNFNNGVDDRTGMGDYGGNTAPPPEYGTDTLMEDSVRAALEDYLNGPDVEGITERYTNDLSQSKVDSRARMGALGMSGSGASASLQAGLARQSADDTEAAINRDKQRLMGNAMAATGMGIGMDSMMQRRALLEALYGPGAGDDLPEDPADPTPPGTGPNANTPYGGNMDVAEDENSDLVVTGVQNLEQATGSQMIADPNIRTTQDIIGRINAGSSRLPGEELENQAAQTTDGTLAQDVDYENSNAAQGGGVVGKGEYIPGWPDVEKVGMENGYTVYRGADGLMYYISGSTAG